MRLKHNLFLVIIYLVWWCISVAVDHLCSGSFLLASQTFIGLGSTLQRNRLFMTDYTETIVQFWYAYSGASSIFTLQFGSFALQQIGKILCTFGMVVFLSQVPGKVPLNICQQMICFCFTQNLNCSRKKRERKKER